MEMASFRVNSSLARLLYVYMFHVNVQDLNVTFTFQIQSVQSESNSFFSFFLLLSLFNEVGHILVILSLRGAEETFSCRSIMGSIRVTSS
jgi:hypothetical protein